MSTSRPTTRSGRPRSGVIELDVERDAGHLFALHALDPWEALDDEERHEALFRRWSTFLTS